MIYKFLKKNFRRHKYKIQHDRKYSAWNMKGQVAKNQVHLHALHCTLSWPIATQLCGQAISFFKDHEMPNLPILQDITIFRSFHLMKFWNCIFSDQKIHVLEILGHWNTYFLIFGQKFLYLIFEAVNIWGFWGPALNGGDEKNKINVVPSIFMKFWSKNNVDQLDRLTP